MPSDPVTRYAVVGHPVAHSQSPFIHEAFALQTGEAIEYARLDCGAHGFDPAIRNLAAGGAGGCNITVPFKFEARKIAAHCSPRAQLAGAANILDFSRDGWLADNTDGVGLLRDIETNADRPLAGRRVLLVGAGGASAGVLGPLLQARPAEIVLVNRTPHRAALLIDRHHAMAVECGVRLSQAPIEQPGRGFDVVINGTASSLQGAAVPIPDAALARDALAIDMMYGPAAQPFLDWASAHGATARDGLGMLVEQAAEAFFVWRGIRPDSAAVLVALRRHLETHG